jgi:O-antigen/teichoic acid export membrane protein
MTIFSIRNSLKNSVWLISEKLFRFLFGFLITTLIIKHLGPTDFGFFTYSLTIASIFGLLSKFGLDVILVKELSENNSDESKLLSSALFIRISFSILSFFLVIPVIYFLGESNLIISLVFIFLICNIFQSYELFESFLQSRLKNKISSLISISVLLIASLVRIIFLYFDYGVLYFSLALLLEIFLLFFILIIFLKYQNISLEKPDFSVCKDLINKSYPLLISSIFAFVYLKIDTIMLRFMTTFESVGIYSSAVKFSELLYFFPILIANSFLPILVKNKKNANQLKNTFFKLFKITLSISLIFIIVLSFFSNFLVELVYGLKYIDASLVIKIHVWSLLFISMNAVCSKLIIIENKQIFFIKISFVGALLNIILNIFLIPYAGIYGAAYSTLFSYFVVSSLIYRKYNSLLNLII